MCPDWEKCVRSLLSSYLVYYGYYDINISLFDSGLSQGSQPSFAELIEIIGNLASEVENAKELYRSQLNLLESKLAEAQQERNEAIRSLDLALVQLRKVQEEFEHYFILSRHQLELLDANEDLHARFADLLVNSNVIG